jgi:hypothetical protein
VSGESAADRLFGFTQFEYPWALGPDAGRYLLRDGAGKDPSHVLVLATLGAPQRRLMRRRRPRNAKPQPEPTPVVTTRATVIGAQPLGDEGAAKSWLAQQQRDPDEELRAGLAVVNRTLSAHRVASADPTVREVSLEGALVVRVGYGTGEQVAEGRWSAALEVPTESRKRQRRAAALRPQERLAALLGARDKALACEELVLRARLDLDAERKREATLQLKAALEVAVVELDGFRKVSDMAERVAELKGAREAIAAAAQAALRDDPVDTDEVARVLGRLEAALRARSAAGMPEAKPQA